MSAEFAAAVRFLAEHRDLVLFCRDREGCPVGYPMRTTAVTGSAIYFTTYRKSAKVRHLERDPVVRLLCFVTRGDDQAEWVDAGGTAGLWSPTAGELDRLLSGPRDSRVPDGMLDHVRTRILEGKRIMVKVELDHAARYAGTTAVE